MNCSYCGRQMPDGAATCTHCGMHVPTPSPAQNDAPIVVPITYKPISVWGYMAYFFLYSIPLIGLILMLVNSFSKDNNVHLKNFSRSYLLICVISFCLGLALVLSAPSGGTNGYELIMY